MKVVLHTLGLTVLKEKTTSAAMGLAVPSSDLAGQHSEGADGVDRQVAGRVQRHAGNACGRRAGVLVYVTRRAGFGITHALALTLTLSLKPMVMLLLRGTLVAGCLPGWCW